MYKFSQFNYFTENNNELLLYNSFGGLNSFCKISKENKDFIKKTLLENNIQDLNNQILFNKLLEKGFIIPYDEDENFKKQLLINDAIYNNDLELIILPTEQCNFRCVYCYESFEKGNMSKETQDLIIKFVRKNIHKYKNLNVSWFGGEPTICIDVIKYMSEQFIDICKKAHKPYIASITSNGYLLNPENVETLIKSRVYTYQITVDGLKKVHNKQKPHLNGSETFDVVINNLINMKKVKSNLLNVIIRTNVSKEIYEILDEYIDFYHNLFSDDKRFIFFIRPVGDWGGKSVKTMDNSLLDKDTFKLSYLKIINNKNNLSFIMHNFLEKSNGMCYAAKRNTYVIDSQGNIRKCTCNLDDDRNLIGKFNKNGDMDINYYKLAKWIVKPKFDECLSCSQGANCLEGVCPWQYNLTNNGKKSCPYEKRYLRETLILADKNNSFEVIF